MPDKRQVTESEKIAILAKHGRRCFVDGAPISEDETIEFHHIQPFSRGGASNIDNVAPVCAKHHRTLGTMTLQEYKDKLRLERFFASGEQRYLDDLILEKTGKRSEKLTLEAADDSVVLYFDDAAHTFPLYRCRTTGWQYFYATLPVCFIENDRDLQPRPLRKNSLWNLYRHFQGNTQLSPSICRIDADGVLNLFDGQHKAAAQIWAGRDQVECKVYLQPNATILKETNLEAHSQFRQMSFYSHELMRKYADIFGEDWSQYMEMEGVKSETGFFNFLVNTKGKTNAQARNEISMAMHKQIIDDPENKLSSFISEKNRTRKQPLTFSRLKKTILKNMLLTPPVEDEFESDTDFRQNERRNLIQLMNIIAEEGLIDRWNPELDNALHRRTQRVFSAGAIRAWTTLLKDTLNAHMNHYTDETRSRFFYRTIKSEDFSYFRQFVKKLFSHQLWDDPDPSGDIAARLAKDDATTASTLFEEHNLTVLWLLGTG